MLTEIGLFAGIGGFQLGFQQAGIETVAMVEIDQAAQGVLGRRFPGVPILSDVREAGAHNLPRADILSFGFPCQDLSVAGKRSGLAGARSGLFYEATRIADELRPALLTWENVPGLLSSNSGRDFLAVLMELDRIGYSGCWTTLDAQFFGVAQRRQRLFGVFARRDIGAAVCAEILSLAARLPWNTQAGGAKRAGVAATIRGGSSRDGVNKPGRRGDDDQNVVLSEPQTFDWQAGVAPNDRAWLVDKPGRTRALTANRTLAVFGGNNTSGERAGDSALTSHGSGRYDFESESFVVASAQSASHGGADDNDAQANHLVAVIKGAAIGRALENGPQYGEVLEDGTCYTLNCTEVHAVLPNVGTTLGKESYSPAKSSSGQMVDFCIPQSYGVRRLTPLECERLQGFPDGWTAEGVNGPQADSARYRQLGNAVCVKVSRWLGRQIVSYL